MKKYILAAAVVFTTGVSILTTISKNNNIKSVKAIKAAVAFDKNVLGNAD